MLARAICAAAVLVALAVVPAAARDVQLVTAQTKLAAGGSSLDRLTSIRLTFNLRQAGLDGAGTTLTDLLTGRSVTRFQLGPMSGAEGFDGKRTWTQDTAGIVIVPEGGDRPAQTLSAQYRQAFAYWYPERVPRASVEFRMQLFRSRVKEALAITPKGGLPFELWFDAQTKLLDRVIEEGATETRVTMYEDYRPVGPYIIAHRIRSSNAAAAFGAERSITKVEINPPVADADFAVPAAPAPDFSFEGGALEAVLPFRLVNNHIYVDAKLNGRTFALLVDTGATSVMTPTVARALRLKSVGDARVRGAGELTEQASFTRVATVGLGAMRLRDQLFAVVPIEKLADVEGTPFHGMIGYEIFKRFVVRIDFAAKTMTLSDARTPIAAAGIAVPFVFNGTVPEIDGEVAGIPSSFDIDTGSRAGLTLNSPFVQRHALRPQFTPSIDGVTGWGLGGPTRGTIARVKRFRLGSLTLDGAILDMSLQREGTLSHRAPAGSIGNGLLKRFTLTFDYPRQRIHFRALPVAPEPFDRAGLWINRAPGGFRIDDVFVGSPAAAAGLRSDDVIVAIDGVAAHALDLDATRARLREAPPGTRLRLTVRSGGMKRDVDVVLRDLI